MLVLTRRQKGRIRIGPNIWFTLVGFNRHRNPRIRIEGPAGTKVFWAEDGKEIFAPLITMGLGGRLRINENIFINIVDIDRGKIRVGIEAPRSVNIVRAELISDGPASAPAEEQT
ncbi:carbon storage regulator [Candidatus Parcubacteria bacterium]|nr:carbon storage regulator [Candidatus Parcubacteria bacterium]